MKKLQVAYFGTPQFSADLLSMILEDKTLPVEIKLVITQPDKKVGRKQILTPSPVKIVAQKYNIPVGTTLGLSLPNIDLAILYAYGQIIPTNLLSIPKFGFWGVHPSLLPKYRGPSPMAFPLIMGDTETGVTIIKMDSEIDHGPIIAQEKLPISPTDKRPDLEKKLTILAFEVVKKIVTGVENGGNPQDHSKSTYTTLLNKKDGFIPFEVIKKLIKNEEFFPEDLPRILTEYYVKNNIPLSNIQHLTSNIYYNLFHGLYPWPGIWTLININGEQKRLKITDVEPPFSINRVQLEGKTEVNFNTFAKAYKILS